MSFSTASDLENPLWKGLSEDATLGLLYSLYERREGYPVRLTSDRLEEDLWMDSFGEELGTVWQGTRGTLAIRARSKLETDIQKVIKQLAVSPHSFLYLTHSPRGYTVVKVSENSPHEFNCLQRLTHPYIVTAFEQFLDSQGRNCFSMQYVAGGQLRQLIQRKGPLPQKSAKYYFLQIALTLKYIHEKGLVHRDLKSQNMLLDFNGDIKIIDFQLCAKDKFQCGTVPFMAPELFEPRDSGKAVDLYAIGIILYEMLSGFLPFRGSNQQIIKQKLSFKIEYPKWIGKQAKSLIDQLTCREPSQRLQLKDLSKHQWLRRQWQQEEGESSLRELRGGRISPLKFRML